jgi:hypothetical protein
MKTPDDYFADWEASVFGFGYGSGEEHILPALKQFMDAAEAAGGGTYDYRELEASLGPVVTWLLINALCHADIIEYGSSPRFGWLTEHGAALKVYLAGRTLDQLADALSDYDEHCYPNHCNCDLEECSNPFWRPIKPRGRNVHAPRGEETK